MAELIQIGKQQVFNLQEARLLLPTIEKITKRFHSRTTKIESRLQRLVMADPRRRSLLEDFGEHVSDWKTKMEGLGVSANNLWQVQFNVGDGFLCWQFPELVISHFLPKGEDWQDKVKLKEYIESYDPDWAC